MKPNLQPQSLCFNPNRLNQPESENLDFLRDARP